jgi:hypothetical protein
MEFTHLHIVLGILGFLAMLGFVLKFYSRSLPNEENIKPLNFKVFKLDAAVKERSQIQYHINWAKHSGDTNRVELLQEELVNVELKISELQ